MGFGCGEDDYARFLTGIAVRMFTGVHKIGACQNSFFVWWPRLTGRGYNNSWPHIYGYYRKYKRGRRGHFIVTTGGLVTTPSESYIHS